MRHPRLRERVYHAARELYRQRLVQHFFGSVSGIDRRSGVVVIKPAGMPYDKLTPEALTAVDLDGIVLEGEHQPAADLPTHLVLYTAFPDIGAVVHTHSPEATVWCQALRPIPCLGATHAEFCLGHIPCTPTLTDDQIHGGDMEGEVGRQIVLTMANLDHRHIPMILVAHHAPYAWGRSPAQAAFNAAMLEQIASLASRTLAINPLVGSLKPSLLARYHRSRHDRRGETDLITKEVLTEG